MRVLLGVFTAACNPPALGLIRDYFPPNSRTLANSVFLASDYLGCCFSSLSIILIENYGWREDYEITGLFGIIFGAVALFYLKEPVRGNFEK
jgi:MFS family permease